MKILSYTHYKWVYILGAIFALVNTKHLQNVLLAELLLMLLYGILLYKNIHILVQYRKTKGAWDGISKTVFREKYTPYRLKIALIWLLFIGLCLVGKYHFHLSSGYFYACTFFFLFLDRFFVNKICLLQKIADFRGEIVPCCCACPLRGWDLMLIHTPLLFALQRGASWENALIMFSALLAFCSLLTWEKQKYFLVEVRKKCAKPCDLQLCREHCTKKTCFSHK